MEEEEQADGWTWSPSQVVGPVHGIKTLVRGTNTAIRTTTQIRRDKEWKIQSLRRK
ncbi:unnamed protein product [Dovyalis caffra]|uniref:Uncharacterized protein n=1 Tax=Dovyalis caffra TaxID=77055 RepID=A0AAV1QUR3_9ROSI|nr:unnamed protein product [Dovyalis caffra]